MAQSNKKSTNIYMDAIKNKFEEFYTSMQPDEELEATFHERKMGSSKSPLSMQTFYHMIEYLVSNETNKTPLTKIVTLDVSYNIEDEKKYENYRVTIDGINRINKFISAFKFRKNHVIFQSLIAKINNDTPGYTIIKKERDAINKEDFNEYNLRLKLAKELNVSKNELLQLNKKFTRDSQKHIFYRYKQRTSLKIFEDDNVIIKVETTLVQSADDINRLEHALPRYELELEITKKTSNTNKKYVSIYMKTLKNVLRVLQQSNFIISTTETEQVITKYNNLVGTPSDTLQYMNVTSLEIQHVTDRLANKYAVTDKADGERHFLIIVNNKLYLISGLLNVINLGIVLPNDSYDGTLLDGEYILLDNSKSIFGAFDILFSKNQDLRSTASLKTRLTQLDQVINYIANKQQWQLFKHSDYEGKMQFDKILDYHQKGMKSFLKTLNHNLANVNCVIVRKYFIFPYGIKDNEIFKYISEMWRHYVDNTDEKKQKICPYTLDGLILTPVDQKYTSSQQETINPIYKWKPSDKNSIDFYCKFLRDNKGNIMKLFDNSNDELVENKVYRICHLHVGLMTREGEKPVLFQQRTGKYEVYLYFDDGEIRDLEGNPIQDGTVVEFYYNNDTSIEEKYRWVPIRTRYDKTESVVRFGRKYGNYITVAERVWRSIVNPVTMSDFENLSNDENYTQYIERMRSKVSARLIELERKESAYYQVKSKMAPAFRSFHNWVKSILIYSQLHPTFNNHRKISVLDIGVGRGGDLMKYFAAEIDFLVGIDPDNYNLNLATDGALSRYKNFKKQHPTFQTMYFIHANPKAILEPVSQEVAIGKMTDSNKSLINKFFSPESRRQFDCISSMFSIHFLLENDNTWGNFIENVNLYLKLGGLFIVTTIDGTMLLDMLGENEKFTSYYTDEHGTKKKFWEAIRKFKYPRNYKTEMLGTGNAIDIFDVLKKFEEGKYQTEYLVDPRFFTKELKDKCGLELIESDTFGNMFNTHSDFFNKGYSDHESDPRTRRFFEESKAYYDQVDEVNKACFDQTKITRYYIFRKVKNITLPRTPRIASESKSKQSSKPSKQSRQSGHQSGHGGKSVIMNMHDIFDQNHKIIFEEKYDSSVKLAYFALDNQSEKKYQKFISDYSDLEESNILRQLAKHHRTNIIIFTELDNEINLELKYTNAKYPNSIIIYSYQKKYYPIALDSTRIFPSKSSFIKNILRLG